MINANKSDISFHSTDGGVHALNSSAHFDLEKYGPNIYKPEHVMYNLNKYFYSNQISITVNNCYRVADDFSARHNALGRTYLYRYVGSTCCFSTYIKS